MGILCCFSQPTVQSAREPEAGKPYKPAPPSLLEPRDLECATFHPEQSDAAKQSSSSQQHFERAVRRQIPRPAGPSRSGSARTGMSPEAWPESNKLVSHLLSFVPRRLAEAFSNGYLTDDLTGSVEIAPVPQETEAALLLVDVSGFSRLSETYSAKSSAGCEEFSHLLSFFFTRMCAIIDEHGGDIDCFAGDALVVVFSCRPQQTSKDKMCSEATASDKQVQPPNDVNNCGLNRQVSSALRCITCISKDLNGFQPSSEYPPLGIHAALAAGKLLSVVCGGFLTPRSEGFIVGEPLQDLGRAMPFSKISELVVSSSAVPYLPGSQIWGKSKMENGFVCIQLPQMSSTNALNRLEQSSNNWVLSGGSKHSITKLKCVKPVLRHAAKVKALLSRAAIDQQSLTFEAEGQSCSDFDMLGVHSRELSSPLFATKDDSALLCSAEFEKQALLTASSAIGNGSNKDAHGLDALIRFVPESARQHCLDGLDPHMLAENRNVAILFMIVDTQVVDTSLGGVQKLQLLLGRAIDIVDGDHCGSTRQITVDEKGLAAIFVFGLQGYKQSGIGQRCLMAAMELVNIMQDGGVPSHVGMDLGSCFCGIVGDQNWRCEFSVVGGAGRLLTPYISCISHYASNEKFSSWTSCSVRLISEGTSPCSPGMGATIPVHPDESLGKRLQQTLGLLDPSQAIQFTLGIHSVNTAARLAWSACKKGVPILCSKAFHDVWKSETERPPTLGMVPDGSLTLKGKLLAIPVYAPCVSLARSVSFGALAEAAAHVGVEYMAAVMDLISECQKGRKTPGMIVVKGDQGVGKSKFLHEIMREVVTLKSIHEVQADTVTIHLSSGGDTRPLSFCRQLLCRLLEVHGDSKAAEFSRLEAPHMLDYSVDQLPALLKPVAKDLETLHELPAPLQAGGFQCLYCKVFASALRGRTTVLLVDGADLVDPVSLSVIFALTHEDQNVMAWNDKPDNGNRKPKSSSKGPDCTEADTNSDQLPKSTETSVEELPTATPLQRRDSSGDTSKGGVNRHSEATHDNRATLTCRSVIVLSTTQPLPIDASSTPNSQSGICLIQLSALEESAAQDFAARLFNCEELSSELRETLSVECKGVPLRIREFCKWLKDTSRVMVDGDGVARLHGSTKVADFKPPSRQSILRANVNQLPPRHTMLLKCASILGHRFECHLLQSLLPERAQRLGSLKTDLEELAAAGLVEQMDICDEDLWQFCQPEYREIVYGMMSHQIRRRLHRSAAQMHADQLAGCLDDSSKWHRYEKISRHLRQAIASAGAIPSSGDVLGYLASTKWLVQQHLRCGQLAEAYQLQEQLREILQPHDPCWDLEWAAIQLRIALACSGTMLALQSCNTEGHVLPSHAERTQSLSSLRDQTLQIADCIEERSADSGAKPTTLFANARMAIAASDLLLTRCVHPTAASSALKAFLREEHAPAKLIYAALFTEIGFASNRFVPVASLTEQMLTVDEAAGSSPDDTGALPLLNPRTTVFLGYCASRLMIGEVEHQGVARLVENRVDLLDQDQRSLFSHGMQSFEALWEPQGSARLTGWHPEESPRMRGGHYSQWRHNAETLTDALRSADLEGQQLQPHFQFAHGGDSAVVGNRSTTVDVEAALAKWSWHTSNAWKAARTSNWGFHAWNVALHCIHAGCRVIFLPVPCGGEVPSSRLRASPGAVQHLGDIKGLLSECLVFWEEQRVSDPACMLLPGALIWGRAMLHWFQLVLSNNDPRLSLSGDFFEDSRLAKAVRGFDRGSSFRPGRAHLCQRLLLAQAVSLASETEYLELLPSALPATVSLAKLLLTRVTHKGWQDSREADSEQPPPPGISLVVPTEPLFESVNGFKRLSVPVEVVQMGSAAALRVASSHLKAILARVRLSGAPLQDLASVRHASDVGGSVILWEAVCLCKAINEELAET